MSRANDFQSVKTADDYLASDVVALREFRLYEEKSSIGGLSYNQTVLPGRNVAQCGVYRESEDHVPPVESCHCGWYAYDEDRRWDQHLTSPEAPEEGRFRAIVHLSGRLIVCERGVKAQHMKVKAVTVHPADKEAVLAILPGVEVFDSEEEMITAHPIVQLDRGQVFRLRVKARNVMQRISGVLTPERMLNAFFILVLAHSFFILARWGFPAGSVSGYGPLIPALLLSAGGALTSILRHLEFYFSYLALWGYGIYNSWEPLMEFTGSIGLTHNMLAVILGVLFLAPAFEIGSERLARKRGWEVAGSSEPAMSSGSITPFAGITGTTISPSGTRLPPKTI